MLERKTRAFIDWNLYCSDSTGRCGELNNQVIQFKILYTLPPRAPVSQAAFQYDCYVIMTYRAGLREDLK